MASLVTHALVGAAIAQAAPQGARKQPRFWFAAVLCAIAPDFDVIGYYFHVRYLSLWGHRGMSHSLLFAAVLAAAATLWMKIAAQDRWKLGALFFSIAASHGVLDALTDGGRGVAFFSPLNRHRYFFPWRPIHVSPIGAGALFSSDALQVLLSEFWIWGPALAVVVIVTWLRRRSTSQIKGEALSA